MTKSGFTEAPHAETLEQIREQLLEAERAFVSIIDAAAEYPPTEAGAGTIALFKYAAEAGFNAAESAHNTLSTLREKGGEA